MSAEARQSAALYLVETPTTSACLPFGMSAWANMPENGQGRLGCVGKPTDTTALSIPL